MCMKHENEYGDCFDHLFFGVDHESWLDHLRIYNVNILDSNALQRCILDGIAKAHEEGYICPMTTEERMEYRNAEWEKIKKELDNA